MASSKTHKRLSKRLSNRLRARLLFTARFAVVLCVSTFLVTSEEQRAAIAQALKDPMALLAERSPGQRQKGALRPAKVRHEVKLPKGDALLSDGRVVDEKDLSAAPGVFAEHEPAPVLPAETTPPADAGKALTGDMPAIAHGGGGSRGFFGSVGGGGESGGGGNPDCIYGDKCGEGSTVPTGDPVPPTPIVEVPEPATWAMALIGFFMLGAMIRRGRPAEAARPHRSD